MIDIGGATAIFDEGGNAVGQIGFFGMFKQFDGHVMLFGEST